MKLTLILIISSGGHSDTHLMFPLYSQHGFSLFTFPRGKRDFRTAFHEIIGVEVSDFSIFPFSVRNFRKSFLLFVCHSIFGLNDNQ